MSNITLVTEENANKFAGEKAHAGKHLLDNIKESGADVVEDGEYVLTMYTGDNTIIVTNLNTLSSINMHIDSVKLNILMGGLNKPKEKK